jgi:AraC family transcriptional regulator
VSTQFVYLRPIHVVAVRARGPYASSAKAAWQQMFTWLSEAGFSGQSSTGYGLLLDDPRKVTAEKRRYEACIELIEDARSLVPESFFIRRLPGGAYARHRHVGGVAGLPSAISSIRDDWVPGEGIVMDSRRPVIEIYLDDPERVPAERQRIDLCVPVSVADSIGQSAA